MKNLRFRSPHQKQYKNFLEKSRRSARRSRRASRAIPKSKVVSFSWFGSRRGQAELRNIVGLRPSTQYKSSILQPVVFPHASLQHESLRSIANRYQKAPSICRNTRFHKQLNRGRDRGRGRERERQRVRELHCLLACRERD